MANCKDKITNDRTDILGELKSPNQVNPTLFDFYKSNKAYIPGSVLCRQKTKIDYIKQYLPKLPNIPKYGNYLVDENGNNYRLEDGSGFYKID